MIKTVEEGRENYKNLLKNVMQWWGPFGYAESKGGIRYAASVLGLTPGEDRQIHAECNIPFDGS